MSLNLQKGQKVDLTRGNPGLSKLLIGLGWDTNKYSGGFDFDLDATVFLLGENHKVNSNQDFIYYGNLVHSSESVEHTGDNLTGGTGADDEQIKVDHFAAPAFPVFLLVRNMARLMTAAISIIVMDDTSSAKMSISSMARKVQAMIVSGIGLFCIFLIILIAASRIRIPTAILTPMKAWAIQAISRKLSRNMEIRKMMLKDGRTIPIVAAIAPIRPFCL